MGIKQQAGRLAFIVLAFSLSGAAAQKLAAPQVIKGSPVVIDADTLQFDGITVRLEALTLTVPPQSEPLGRGRSKACSTRLGLCPLEVPRIRLELFRT